MASTSTFQEGNNTAVGYGNRKDYRFTLCILTMLFFIWGFITCLNDILIPYLKSLFDLTYTQAMLIQFCFFSAYFIISIPAGYIVSKLGYKQGIVLGLLIASLGCLMFYPAANVGVYPLFLFALFVLAAGITILQVSANPYVSLLGPNDTASSRLTMTQAFNSLGTTIAPIFGAWFIFSDFEQAEIIGAESVQTPYLMLAGVLALLAGVFKFLQLPEINDKPHEKISLSTAFQFKHLKLGAIAIFVYVGAEVAIGSFLVNFLMQENVMAYSEKQASHYLAYYWGGAMIGRFIGAIIMQKISANKVLFFNATCSIALIFIAMFSNGFIAMWSLLAVGLFNSIMFPTIFSLAINKLGSFASHGAGVLCLAIVGGAIIPLIQGMLTDFIGIQLAFILPVFCYLFILYYGHKGYKPSI